MKRRSTKALTATTLATALFVTGCSTKAADSSDSGAGDGDVKTDVGVTDDEINLLELSDLSGVFKTIGLAYGAGIKVWTDEVNAAGGICDRKINVITQDTVYKVENAVPLYEQHKGNAAAMIGLGGSHILAALKQKITTDNMLTVPGSWASLNLDSPAVLMVGQTYDIEMLNGLSYLQEQGMISDGDTIGHIYTDSEYGQNGIMGSKAYAKQHDMTIVEVPLSASDTDLTASITKLKSDGVTAIAITTPPAALGSAAVQNVQQGLNVPIVGSSPAFAPTLLTDPGVEAALSNFYMTSSAVPIGADNPKAQEILGKIQQFSQDEPNIGSILSYTWGLAYAAVLEQACEDGDMTRAGIIEAKGKVDSVESENLSGALDFTQPGAPTSRETYILQPDKSTPGLLTVTADLFASDEAKEYKAPHEE